jgi:lipoate-protein ligase B
MSGEKIISCLDLGMRDYRAVLELQRTLCRRRQRGEVADLMILCGHPPVYTVGRQDSESDWLSGAGEIAASGIDVVRCERGGRITYHGPGQMVAYFILRLDAFSGGVKDFVGKLEEACIGLISGMGGEAERDAAHPGVWMRGGKVAAVGLSVSRGVTMHGIAINVSPDLLHYRHIVPCGIKGRGVTSLANELQREIGMEEAKLGFVRSFGDVFTCRVVRVSIRSMMKS